MINDLKMGIKYVRFGVSAMPNAIGGSFMLLLGLVLEIVQVLYPENYFGSLGIILLICAAAIPAQQAISVSVSTLAQSSACKKKLQTAIPTLLMGAGVTASLTVSALTRGIGVAAGADGLLLKGVIYDGFAVVLLVIYFAFVYKYFVASIVFLMFGAFGSGIFGGMDRGLLAWLLGDAVAATPSALCVVIAYGMVFAAIALQYLISLALYKRPVSKAAFGAALRRSMQ